MLGVVPPGMGCMLGVVPPGMVGSVYTRVGVPRGVRGWCICRGGGIPPMLPRWVWCIYSTSPSTPLPAPWYTTSILATDHGADRLLAAAVTEPWAQKGRNPWVGGE